MLPTILLPVSTCIIRSSAVDYLNAPTVGGYQIGELVRRGLRARTKTKHSRLDVNDFDQHEGESSPWRWPRGFGLRNDDTANRLLASAADYLNAPTVGGNSISDLIRASFFALTALTAIFQVHVAVGVSAPGPSQITGIAGNGERVRRRAAIRVSSSLATPPVPVMHALRSKSCVSSVKRYRPVVLLQWTSSFEPGHARSWLQQGRLKRKQNILEIHRQAAQAVHLIPNACSTDGLNLRRMLPVAIKNRMLVAKSVCLF
jgi:hypothetical protein